MKSFLYKIINHFHKHNIKYVLMVFICSLCLSIVFLTLWLITITKTEYKLTTINYSILAYQALFSMFLALTFNSFCQATYLSFIKKTTQRKLEIEETNKILLEKAVKIVTTKAPTFLEKWFSKKPKT